MGICLLELVEVFNELMVCVVVRENLPVTVSICLYIPVTVYPLRLYISHSFYYDFELTARNNVDSQFSQRLSDRKDGRPSRDPQSCTLC